MTEFNIDFSYAYGKPSAQADFRTEVDDFIVTENLGFELTGEGEHLYVQICKRGENTGWISEKLAQFFGVRTMDVGFAGMKDRHAKTTQWFSLYLPKYSSSKASSSNEMGEIDWPRFVLESGANIQVLSWGWHKQKLRRGMHASNSFEIRLRNISDLSEIETRMEQIGRQGVPNYFGEQRFGRDAGNLLLADKWFNQGELIRKKKLRGMVMSAARSYVFNLVLQHRVNEQLWTCVLSGDIDTSSSDEDAIAKLSTGPLWGRGRSLVSGDTLKLEQETLGDMASWLDGLEHCGMDQERRNLVLKPQNFHWQLQGNNIVIGFSLLPGLYATSILREIVQLHNMSQKPISDTE